MGKNVAIWKPLRGKTICVISVREHGWLAVGLLSRFPPGTAARPGGVTPKWLGLACSPMHKIIGRLDLPFGWTAAVPRPGPTLTGIREEWEAGLILTDPTVWTGKAWGALAAVPVIPIHTGSAVVAAGEKKEEWDASLNLEYLQACFTDVHLCTVHHH